MERINVADAARNFSDLLERVYEQGLSVELERGDKVVARIVPAGPTRTLRVEELNDFFASLPKLGDDAEAFAEDVMLVCRALPVDPSPWE
jgi:antitoxin (DNA-binding transcriptional repressor) of toxin-antitoxin stability system